MKLAIVGSREFVNPEWREIATAIIDEFIKAENPDTIVTGGAKGIDRLAMDIAEKNPNIYLDVKRAKHNVWEPEGFKQRNIEICKAADMLISIRCPQAKTFGSFWAANFMERTLNKPTFRFEINPGQSLNQAQAEKGIVAGSFNLP